MTLRSNSHVWLAALAIVSVTACGMISGEIESPDDRASALTGGNGLKGEYFNNPDFTDLRLTRTDATVDFNWGKRAPSTAIGADTFSIRWTGQVEAPVTGTYTFTTSSDDGVRLSVGGQQLVDQWTVRAFSKASGAIALTAGQRYDVVLEYFENTGKAIISLAWAPPGSASTIVPSDRLFPPGTPPPACIPSCSGKQCGPDGCGGSCGTCESGTCDAEGHCITAPPACTPSCSGKQCGPDGCGGSCGTCASGTCDAGGQCVTTGPASGFPNASNTGVPAGTVLSPYTGPCSITAANTVIDSKIIDCDLRILAANVTIIRSQINGTVETSENSTGYSFTITDSRVEVGDRPGTGVGSVNFTATRVHVTGGNRSMHCWHDCVIRDCYVHGQMSDESGFYHESGIRMGQNATIQHNTIICDAPDFPPDAGCSADLTGYGDFGPVQNNLVENNFFGATTGGFCAYGGSSAGKPYSEETNNIHFIGNVFERGPLGRCGYWGAITSFDSAEPGNFWSNNTWDDGTPLQP